MSDTTPPSVQSTEKFSRFVVRSSDVLQDARINVLEESSDKVIWYKERFLGDNEIIEHLVHNPTSTVCWIIHRPASHGWYIRIRSPSFPPGVFIPLLPVPSSSLHHTEAALSFRSRTNLPPAVQDSYFTAQAGVSTSVHSYPPTPPPAPALVLQPPSPTSSQMKLGDSAPHNTARSSISEFILAPYAAPIPSRSLFARMINVFKDYEKSNSYSFSLSRLAVQSPPPYSTPTTPPETITPTSPTAPSSVKCLPLLTFTDRTPALTFRSLTGLMEIDQAEERILGVETSFWVAVALTYLDFLEDRGSYLASLGD